MTDAEVLYLSLDDVLYQVQDLGFQIRDIGLLDSAVARPKSSAFEKDAYLTLYEKAAALLDSLVNNHPLVDGNKRLGWVATATFLGINGVAVDRISNDDAYNLVMDAVGGLGVGRITTRLQALVEGG